MNKKWLAPCGAIGLVLLAWGVMLGGSFQYDDFPNLLNDPATAGGAPLVQRLLNGIRPLTRLSHVLDLWAWGTWAGGWLLGNLVLHVMSVAGIFLIARLCGASIAVSAFAAALFGLQPAHGMTVAYVSGRAAALMSTLLIFALYCHARASLSAMAALQWRVLSLLLYMLAALAKETAVCFPLLLGLWEWSRQRGTAPWTRIVGPVLPGLVVTLMVGTLALSNDRYQQLLAYSLSLRDPMEALAQNCLALPATLSLLLSPWDLSVVHVLPQSTAVRTGLIASFAAWMLGALLLNRHSRWITLGMLWPVIALLPSHSFIAKADAVSESGLYLCWAGPCIAFAMYWRTKALHTKRWTRVTCLGSLLMLAVLCGQRAAVWADPVRLWHEATQSAPASARAWNNLGMAHLARDETVAARAAFDHALSIDPRHPGALYNRQLLDLVN